MLYRCFRWMVVCFYSTCALANIYRCHDHHSSVYVYSNAKRAGQQCLPVADQLSKIPASLLAREDMASLAPMTGKNSAFSHHGRMPLSHGMMTSHISPALQKEFDAKREVILKRELYEESVALLTLVKKIEVYWQASPEERSKEASVYHTWLNEKKEHEDNIHALRQEIQHVEQVIRKSAR